MIYEIDFGYACDRVAKCLPPGTLYHNMEEHRQPLCPDGLEAAEVYIFHLNPLDSGYLCSYTFGYVAHRLGYEVERLNECDEIAEQILAELLGVL